MSCRGCGAELAAGTRFCPTCGTAVEATCVSCGVALPPDARFCPACGTPTATGTARTSDVVGIAASPGAAPAPLAVRPSEPAATARERKIATIVFADIVGFTSLNERLDPEHVQVLVGRVFDRLSVEVVRYEGFIEKFAGDAMLAIFGVPAIHEDDAERAVRAALEMQAAMSELAAELRAEGRPELALRIGVETGEVLVDIGRAADERDRIVTGDTVNTAARLQQTAGPGTVIVGSTTYVATRDLVDYEELAAIPLKGKERPVAAWRAVAVKARRGGVRAPLGIEAPLVGRDEEIGLLKETVRRTVSEGRPHLVTVIGSAGVGKSRLTWELEKYLDGLPDVYTWRKGRCLAYAQASYSALADVVKADARLLDDDAPATALAKADARLAELGSSAADPSIREALRAVLGLGSTTPTTREALFDGWRRYLEALARDAPLVLVLEDIHWADDGLLDFIEFLARWAEAPIMILALARHELVERRPAWGGGIPNAANIVLEPLDAEESVRLLDHLLSGGMPAVLRDRVVALADGNPLFTEELVRMFVDQGVLRFVDGRWELAQAVDEVEVPGSIQAVLAARLDGLPASEKRMAQDAAVVGRIFWDAVLAHLGRQGASPTAELLRRLRVKELVVPRQPSALAGAAEFGFRHVLIRDVAYDSLPKRDRAAKHLDVAQWAEHELADRADEMVELLASHYLSALTYEEEFGSSDPARLRDLRLRTYGHARRAADRAKTLDQKALRSEWLRVAIRLAATAGIDPRERIALAMEYVGRGALSDAPERLVPAAEDALHLYGTFDPAPGDEDTRLELTAALGVAAYVGGAEERARSLLTDALVPLESAPPSAGRAHLRAALGWLMWRAGPVADAPAVLEGAIADAQAVDLPAVERTAVHDLGVASGFLGDTERGLELLHRSFILAGEAGDEDLRFRCYINIPAVMTANGDDPGRAMAFALEGLRLARRSVNRSVISWIAANIGDGMLEIGRPLEGLAYHDEAIAAAEAIGDTQLARFERLNRGWVRLMVGDLGGYGDDRREVGETAGVNEPQGRGFRAMERAVRQWPRDPVGAIAAAVAFARNDIEARNADVGLWIVRMATRRADADAVREGVEIFIAETRLATGPVRRIQDDWVAAALLVPAEAAAGCEAAAGELEQIGRLLNAADAWADAAIHWERAAQPDRARDAAERATRMYRAMSIVPPLGWPGSSAAGETTATDPARSGR
ncbi:MAG TPA: adenylate/guanylate cyclase domain-containing protein [Candidatus Acidoferrum sp.]|nr:adenylate/guanylate cyclase domain-containing protein [Candidatus Acidoferrum sp.]